MAERLSGAIRPGGFFINLEPTNGNRLFQEIRDRIYSRNSLFDEETERAFSVDALLSMFRKAGLEQVDVTFPGLAACILYYNPDAFPWLNVGGEGMVRATYGMDRVLLRRKLGRILSFATLRLWRRPLEPV